LLKINFLKGKSLSLFIFFFNYPKITTGYLKLKKTDNYLNRISAKKIDLFVIASRRRGNLIK